jgi:hypothetical protein
MTDTERLIRLEHDCNVLACMLGLCAGTAAKDSGSRGFANLMQDAAMVLANHGVTANLVDAFATGARIGMEPPPPDSDSVPLGEGLRNNVVALLRKAA